MSKFQEHLIKTEEVLVMTKSNTGFFQKSRGCNSKINDWIGPVFKLVQDFIHFHLICRFQADPIKTGQVTLITMSNRDFFSKQGDVTLRLMTRSGQFTS